MLFSIKQTAGEGLDGGLLITLRFVTGNEFKVHRKAAVSLQRLATRNGSEVEGGPILVGGTIETNSGNSESPYYIAREKGKLRDGNCLFQ